LLAAPGAGSSAPSRVPTRVPSGFVGTVVGTPLFPNTNARVSLAQQLDVMVASGVETVRVALDWASAQPYSDWNEVPASKAHKLVDAGGIPTDFGPIDQLVTLAAQRGLTVLPTILNAPAWDSQYVQGATVDIPKSPYWYAQFVKALVERYGPQGTFWNNHSPTGPIRMWQIWNEVNIPAFWPQTPSFATTYVTLLQAASAAIKGADPGAQVVLAGLPNYSWVNLAQIYQVSGARAAFDVVAVHPYTRSPRGVITILSKVRRVMNAAGDRRKPIVADEISWPSAQGQTTHTLGLDIATTEAGQARELSQVIPLLGKNRKRLGLMGFYYYTWASTERRDGLPFDFAGLLKFSSGRFVEKPALAAFSRAALALERCRRKRARAVACARST
jgi:hypothetical protein